MLVNCPIIELVNKRQRESLAKFLYNIATIMFATLVVGNFAFPGKFNLQSLTVGVIGTYYAVTSALELESEKKRKRKEKD